MEENNKVILEVVDTPSQIQENINTFIKEAKSNPDFTRELLRKGQRWVYDPDNDTFGFAKFVGFKKMNFANYRKCKNNDYKGDDFDGGDANNAIEKSINKSSSKNEELKKKLIIWGEKLADKNVFTGIKESKWRFIELSSQNNFPINSYSWSILSPTVFLKTIDKSVFKDGTGIPINIRNFFGIENMVPLQQRKVILTHKDASFDAIFKMDEQPTPRTQLRWVSSLAKLLQDEFPEWHKAIINDAEITSQLPEIRFTKTDEYAYSMEFIHPSEIELDIESDYADDYEPQKEGKIKYYYGKRYERKTENRKRAIEIHGTTCVVCGFDFEKVYGSRGKGYIEVHHTEPLGENGKEVVVNAETDLVPVCSNCHKMIHRRRSDILTVEQMKELICC